jgi:hypothetical protein
MAVIDADAHVVETERTWEYMEEAESLCKPEVVGPSNSNFGDQPVSICGWRSSPRIMKSIR